MKILTQSSKQLFFQSDVQLQKRTAVQQFSFERDDLRWACYCLWLICQTFLLDVSAEDKTLPADKCCNNIVSDNHISPLYFRSEKRRECNKGERFVYLQTAGRHSESSTRLLKDQLALFFRGIPPKINTTTLCVCSIFCVRFVMCACLFSLYGLMISVLWYITCTSAWFVLTSIA